MLCLHTNQSSLTLTLAYYTLQQCDTRIAAANAGLDLRPLIISEIQGNLLHLASLTPAFIYPFDSFSFSLYYFSFCSLKNILHSRISRTHHYVIVKYNNFTLLIFDSALFIVSLYPHAPLYLIHPLLIFVSLLLTLLITLLLYLFTYLFIYFISFRAFG